MSGAGARDVASTPTPFVGQPIGRKQRPASKMAGKRVKGWLTSARPAVTCRVPADRGEAGGGSGAREGGSGGAMRGLQPQEEQEQEEGPEAEARRADCRALLLGGAQPSPAGEEELRRGRGQCGSGGLLPRRLLERLDLRLWGAPWQAPPAPGSRFMRRLSPKRVPLDSAGADGIVALSRLSQGGTPTHSTQKGLV